MKIMYTVLLLILTNIVVFCYNSKVGTNALEPDSNPPMILRSDRPRTTAKGTFRISQNSSIRHTEAAKPDRRVFHTENSTALTQDDDLQSTPYVNGLSEGRQLIGPHEKKSRENLSNKEPKDHCTSARNCSCILLKDGTFRAECAKLELTSVPYFEQDVSEIDLFENTIARFPEIGVFPRNFTYLSLSNNALTAFGNNPFEGLHCLKILDLSQNYLEYRPTIYKSHIFKHLTHLEALHLQKNNEGNHHLYPTEIAKIRTLKTLHLDGMEGASFPACYKNLTLLTSLHLGGERYQDACKMQNININTFENLPPIKHLDLTFCTLHNIEKSSLRKLKSIQSIDISNNEALTFRVLSNVSSGLQFTDIKSLKLDHIHCKAGIGTILYVEDIQDLSNSSLVDISLKKNRLEVIEFQVFNILPKSLKNIDVSYNRLQSLFLLLYMFQMPMIEKIYFGSKSITDNDGTSPSDLQNCPDWRGPKNHMISNRGMLKKMHIVFQIDVQVSPSLQEIYASNLHIKSDLEKPLVFSQPNNISTIDMSNSGLNTWIGGFRNLRNLIHLDLSDNACTNLSDVFFSDFPSLRYLNIRNNFLGYLLSLNSGLRYFEKLNRLEHFDISNINIQHLPLDIFRGLSRLKILNASRNILNDWTARIDHMTRLRFLDLKSNRIRSLNSATMDVIDFIASNSSIKIDLSDNSLLCTCDTLFFLKWMNQRQALFVNFGDYQCVHNNALVKFKDLADILSSLEKNCASYSEVIAGVVVVILLVIALIVGGILYRYRWRIRYIYQMARKGLKPLNQADVFDFEFDGFMSYAEEDRNFVVKEALPVLEDRFGLKLRLHQRDFTPGDSIAANITYNIHKSRKTIAVISSSFLKSYWCMFEFNMARMESIYTRGGEPMLLLVLLEDLRPRDLPLMMLDIIDSDSYLKVPVEKNEEFWDNFRKAILMK